VLSRMDYERVDLRFENVDSESDSWTLGAAFRIPTRSKYFNFNLGGGYASYDVRAVAEGDPTIIVSGGATGARDPAGGAVVARKS